MYSPATLEEIKALILEHDKVWFNEDTPLRTLMYHHSKLINRLNDAESRNRNVPAAVKNQMGR